MKPHLACDADLSKIKLPIFVMPKIDGVRALHVNGKFTGRSLKGFDNVNITEHFSLPIFQGLDGELTIGSVLDGETCRRTTSGTSTIDGPSGENFTWWIFDDLSMHDKPYQARLLNAMSRAQDIHQLGIDNIRVVPHVLCNNRRAVEEMHLMYIRKGYEGTILRDPDGKHKDGRATAREAAFLRIKDFVEEEFLITGLEEGEENRNVATTNELGRTARSSHKENKVPNGMVGTLLGTDLKTGDAIRVAAGCMTHDERRKYFLNPELILGKVGKYRTMAYGKKDLPRFPTFQMLRPAVDMVEE